MEEVPFEDRHVPKVEIDWDRSVWWWYPLSRAIHPAMRMLALALSLVALLLIQLGFQVGEWLFAPAWSHDLRLEDQSIRLASLSLMNWFRDIAVDLAAVQSLRLREVGFVTFEMIWITLVVSICGGIIARRGAVELGQRTVAAWGESCWIVLSRWQSYLWSTGMHLVAITAMLIPTLLIGLIGRLGPIGAMISGILLLACFPLVFGIGRFALSAVICFPLSVCGISLEKQADAFEGFSRSNAYLFQRPIAAAICVGLLILAGIVGEQIVYWTLSSGWWLLSRSYSTTANLPATDYQAAGTWLVNALIAAYGFSFFWTASAATYLILRKSVDHTELDEMENLVSPIEQSLPEIPKTPPVPTEAPEPPTGEAASR